MADTNSRRALPEKPTGEDLRRFYEATYLETNPAILCPETGRKADLLDEIVDSKTSHGRRILEIGCGHGVLLDMLARRWNAPLSVGLDLSATMLRRALAGFETSRFVQGDAQRLPFRVGSLDVVYLADALEHLPEPEKALAEIRRAATDLVCLVPLESGLVSDLHYRWRVWRGKPTNREIYGHLHRFRLHHVVRLLQAAGFGIVRQRLIVEPGHPASSLLGRLYQIPQRLTRRFPLLHGRLYGEITFVAWCR